MFSERRIHKEQKSRNVVLSFRSAFFFHFSQDELPKLSKNDGEAEGSSDVVAALGSCKLPEFKLPKNPPRCRVRGVRGSATGTSDWN